MSEVVVKGTFQRVCEDIRRLAAQCLVVERLLEDDRQPVGGQQRSPDPPLAGDDDYFVHPSGETTVHSSSPSASSSDARHIYELARELRHSCERFIPENRASRERTTILVVDDAPDMRDYLTLILSQAGFHVVTAPDGLEGIIAAHRACPSLILMDMSMPVLDGMEATRLLKAAGATCQIPVVAHTLTPAICHVPDGVLFAHVLPKPVIPAVLLALVRRFVPAAGGSA